MLVLFVTVLMGRGLADEKFRLPSESRHPPECYDRGAMLADDLDMRGAARGTTLSVDDQV
jgi:hypothetical protein